MRTRTALLVDLSVSAMVARNAEPFGWWAWPADVDLWLALALEYVMSHQLFVESYLTYM